MDVFSFIAIALGLVLLALLVKRIFAKPAAPRTPIDVQPDIEDQEMRRQWAEQQAERRNEPTRPQ